MAFGSFVAIGDSFTEGLNDELPDGSYRGWADRTAAYLAASEPGLRYANLAVRGKRLGEIVDEQLPHAIDLAPGLISIAAGANDILRPSGHPDALVGMFDDAVRRMGATGATVVIFTGYESPQLTRLRRLRDRVMEYNDHLRAIAGRHGCLLVDMWAMDVLRGPEMWSDSLHLTAEGHQWVTLEACRVLGIPVPADREDPWMPQISEPVEV